MSFLSFLSLISFLNFLNLISFLSFLSCVHCFVLEFQEPPFRRECLNSLKMFQMGENGCTLFT